MVTGKRANKREDPAKNQKMPVKKAATKRKNRSGEKIAVPAKVAKLVPGQQEEEFVAKRLREQEPGQVLTLGQGDVGQLGLGPDVIERSRPTPVAGLSDIVDICAGGMHTICLNKNGEVITFGCNDEGALGRTTTVEGSETEPGFVKLDGKAVQISAGDSHSAALLEDGRVFAWGSYRDSHGAMGLTSEGIIQQPMWMPLTEKVKMIASGNDHLLILTKQGQLYTCGCGEQGQLGRVSERVADRNSRQGLNQLLIPALVNGKSKNAKSRSRFLEFENIWTGAYCTFAQAKDSGEVLVCGLNNYTQLGLNNTQSHFHPTMAKAFSDKRWTKICGGQHHTIALDTEGLVYSLGRQDYGRLGLGRDCTDQDKPTVIPALKDKKCIDIACGTCVSFAVTDDGEVYSWGMGTNGQLGAGEDEDLYEPTKMLGKQLENKHVLAVAGGGQHTVLLVKSREGEQTS